MQHAQGEMQAGMLKEQQVEAARVQEVLQAALRSDGQTLLSEDEITAIQEALSRLAEVPKVRKSRRLNKLLSPLIKPANYLLKGEWITL